MNRPPENFETIAPQVYDERVDHVAGMKRTDGEFPLHNTDAPILSGIDIAGLLGMALMTLGPLAACAFGA